MTYQEALDWLYGTQLFGIKLGLEPTRRLVTSLDAWPGDQKILHVAGTNGKGSVCVIAESLARQAGYRTGLFTSPHLIRFNERIKIDGQDVNNEEIAGGLSRIRRVVETWETHPTFFEITLALSLLLFQQHGCEVLVMETGMGGRLDATNILFPTVSVITRIDIDHARWLGDTLAQIAGEKAGIIKPGIPVVTLPQDPAVLAVLEKSAGDQQAPFHLLTKPHPHIPPVFTGAHQHWNTAAALAAVRLAGIVITPKICRQAFDAVRWPGRFQEIRPGVFLDGAHNPAAAVALVETWRLRFSEVKPNIIIGVLADKEIEKILVALAPIARSWIAVSPRSARSLSTDLLATRIQESSPSLVQVSHSFAEAMEKVVPPVLVCGSLFLVGEALAYYENQPAIRLSNQ